MENLIEVQNLNKEYTIGTGNVQQVLKNCSLSIQKGEFVSVMGASGSGKSTLLYNVSGMDKPSSGSVTFAGTSITSIPEGELTKLRLERMGFIFQQNHFLKNLNILDNIVLPAYLNKKEDRKEINAYAKDLMKQTEILDLMEKDTTQASGGQLQRASICRALISRPEILFGDEPTGALNSSAANDVMRILKQIHMAGTTIMLVTHDPKIAAKTERILFMSDGMLVGELSLGRYTDENALKERESKVSKWLLEQGF